MYSYKSDTVLISKQVYGELTSKLEYTTKKLEWYEKECNSTEKRNTELRAKNFELKKEHDTLAGYLANCDLLRQINLAAMNTLDKQLTEAEQVINQLWETINTQHTAIKSLSVKMPSEFKDKLCYVLSILETARDTSRPTNPYYWMDIAITNLRRLVK